MTSHLTAAGATGAEQDVGNRLALDWVQPMGLVGLSIANFALRIATLGIYHFWAKTEVRRRLWSAVRIHDEPLEYTGTGRELLIGFLIVFALVLLPLMLAGIAIVVMFGPQSRALAVFQLLVYVLIALLIGVGTYRAQRYRLSRTRWRGIRMGLVGSSWRYGWTYLWTLLLLPITLGWATPWRTTRLQRMITEDMRFGDRPFRFDGRAGPLYGPFTILWVGTLVVAGAAIFAAMSIFGDIALLATAAQRDRLDNTLLLQVLGLVYGAAAVALLAYSIFSAYYRAAQINHFAAHTFFEGANFRGAASGAGLIWLAIGNFLLWLLGIGLVLLLVMAAVVASVPLLSATPLLTRQVLIWLTILLMITSTGLLGPIIQARTTRYLVKRLKIDGPVPLAQITQGHAQDIRRGEGLAEAFDIDAF